MLRGGVALVERGGNISGLAWRYAGTGARYGAPRVGVPVVRCSQSVTAAVQKCLHVHVCQKCRFYSELPRCSRRYELVLYVGLDICTYMYTCMDNSRYIVTNCIRYDKLVTGQ